jgi:hypothetical protein
VISGSDLALFNLFNVSALGNVPLTSIDILDMVCRFVRPLGLDFFIYNVKGPLKDPVTWRCDLRFHP